MEKLKRKPEKQKVLLMGKSGAGKTSMRSIIFHHHVAKDTRKLKTTIAIETRDVKFLGNLMLNIWDCGGYDHVSYIHSFNSSLLLLICACRQDAWVESYLAGGKDGERQKVFSGVGVLIYVFDVESREFETDGQSSKDLETYAAIVKALEQCSPQARVFALVHKMDLVQTEYKDRVLEDKARSIRQLSGRFEKTVHVHGTSIWDQTLYKAWGSIVHSLIPNLEIIERVLSDLAETTDAEEIILFEQTTFLMITSVQSEVGKRNPYDDRYERLSNIIKTFKSSLGYAYSPLLMSPQCSPGAHAYADFINAGYILTRPPPTNLANSPSKRRGST